MKERVRVLDRRVKVGIHIQDLQNGATLQLIFDLVYGVVFVASMSLLQITPRVSFKKF